MTILHIDLETNSNANLKECGVWRYAEDASTSITCVAFAFDDEPVQAVKSELGARVVDHIAAGGLVYAHNAAFEQAILYHVYGIENVNMRCTAAVAAYHALPPSLEGVAEALNLDSKKDLEGSKLLRKYLKPDAVRDMPHEDLIRMMDYCKQDVEVERAVHNRLGDLPRRELAIWKLDQKMNARGITVDTHLADKVIARVKAAKIPLVNEVIELSDGKITKPTQGKRIIEWLAERGIETDNLTAETVKALLAAHDDKDVQRMLTARQNGAGVATGKFTRAVAMQMLDGRVRGNLRYHGATTGRWAGSGLQIQNLPRGNVSDTDTLADLFLGDADVDEIAGDVFKAAKSAVRPMLTASEGMELVVVDYASIEARALAWLAGEQELIDSFNSGADIYCSFAESVFGRPITKADKKERMVGKVGILGLGYGMGANKFQATLKDWAGMNVDLKFAQKVVDSYRQKYSKIVDFWYSLENSALDCLRGGLQSDENRYHMEGRTLCYTLPSGRIIRYQMARIGQGKFGDAIHFRKPLGKNMVYSDTYSGKLAENVTQAVARDIMADALLALDSKGYRLLATIHDEIILEVEKESAESTLREVEHIMRENARWSEGLPLDVEGFHSFRYKK